MSTVAGVAILKELLRTSLGSAAGEIKEYLPSRMAGIAGVVDFGKSGALLSISLLTFDLPLLRET
jgi:hypothetical protein